MRMGAKSMDTIRDEKLREALSGDRTPIFLATVGQDGRPNLVPVISIEPWDDKTLIFGEFMIRKTKANLETNPNVAVGVMDAKLNTWWIRGRFLGFERTGEKFEKINNQDMFRYNAYTGIRSAGSIAIDEVSECRTFSPLDVLARFAMASVRRAAAPGGSKHGPMPARVRDKFARLKAAKFAAWVGEDGRPHVRAAMGMYPAGASQITLAADDLNPGPPPPGAALACSLITFDPIAYQVKGVLTKYRDYPGFRLARVDVDEVYSASPPLPGHRIA
jgi:predicted pyridoxine 5'-phosphate oxidase superfamily flavin-nucleotide-binding protein